MLTLTCLSQYALAVLWCSLAHLSINFNLVYTFFISDTPTMLNFAIESKDSYVIDEGQSTTRI